MTNERTFELVDYELIAKIGMPLMVALCTNGKWVLKGVLTEATTVKGPKVFEEICEHFDEHHELFERQVLMTLFVDRKPTHVALCLKPLIDVDAEGQLRAGDDLTELEENIPVAYSFDNINYISCFDGTKEFHANYPELVASIEPIVDLYNKITERVVATVDA